MDLSLVYWLNYRFYNSTYGFFSLSLSRIHISILLTCVYVWLCVCNMWLVELSRATLMHVCILWDTTFSFPLFEVVFVSFDFVRSSFLLIVFLCSFVHRVCIESCIGYYYYLVCRQFGCDFCTVWTYSDSSSPRQVYSNIKKKFILSSFLFGIQHTTADYQHKSKELIWKSARAWQNFTLMTVWLHCAVSESSWYRYNDQQMKRVEWTIKWTLRSIY